MKRIVPWLVAVVCVLAGVGLWLYRTRYVDAAGAASALPAEEIVRNAWTLGRKVALHGRQQSLMPGPDGKPVTVEADVLTSSDGCLRIEYLSPPLQGARVWECDGRTYRFNPSKQRLTVAHSRNTRKADSAPEARILANYDAQRVGEESVAGKPALVVELHPEGEGSRWKRLWIDPQTWVILASEDYGPGERILRSTRFTQVEYLRPGAEPAETEFRPDEALLRRFGSALAGDTSSRFTVAQLSRIIGFPLREPAWLPSGYTLEGAYQVPCTCGRRHQAARLEYSDGLNHLTLFECGHPRCDTRGNCFGNGEDLSTVALVKDGYRYLAVGDASPEDLKRMVRSAVAR